MRALTYGDAATERDVSHGPFFSVIVPVYNVEPYLEECASSVLGQTFLELELVLVDDGSTDGSSTVCDRIADTDPRVQVVHKINGGLSSARNAGILRSSGTYLLFVDGDDYYDDCTFLAGLHHHILAHRLPQSVMFARKYLASDGAEIVRRTQHLDEGMNSLAFSQMVAELIRSDRLAISACTRSTRRDLVVGKSLFFEEGLLSEDVDWSLRLLDVSSDMTVLDLSPYAYRSRRDGSITNSIATRNVADGIRIVEKYASDYRNSLRPIREVLLEYVAYQYCVFCGLLTYADRLNRQDLARRLRRLRWLLEYDSNPKVRRVRQVMRTAGFSATTLLLGIVVRLKRA